MRESLGTLLVRNGVATDRDVKDALEEGKKTGEPLGEVLVRTGVASEMQVGKLLAEQWQLQYVEADELEVDEVAALRITRSEAAQLGATPIAYDGDTIIMAIVEPRAELFTGIAQKLGEAAYVVVSPSTFEQLIGQPHVPQLHEPTVDSSSETSETQDEPTSDMDEVWETVVTDVAAETGGDFNSDNSAVEPIETELAKIDGVLAESNRLSQIDQMLNEALPLVRTRLTEQHAALAALEAERRRDAERIRELEAQLSRQDDLFLALRGQATALAATIEQAAG